MTAKHGEPSPIVFLISVAALTGRCPWCINIPYANCETHVKLIESALPWWYSPAGEKYRRAHCGREA